ncbi:uncharacterized protein DUF2523 [Methylobacter tundripaludum]|uniref:Uncharacterized protein DUF2523 n=1 Tax=Methylobacter tundripaludum TaxID=173365 RepID=A0A2S6H395_9GAMM|nr:DUF2523 family protein [Methylobacter tundripaludum]PPK71890.1 uncharacterized protein DUF2523 [Methylobacter tundripaludum]
MIDLLNYLFDSVYTFFTFTYRFLTDGLYTFATWAFTQFVEASTLAYLNFMLWVLPFVWGVAKNIINDLGITSLLSSAWSSIDSKALAYLTVLRLPDSLNLIISAYFTKFVLKFIPFT